METLTNERIEMNKVQASGLDVRDLSLEEQLSTGGGSLWDGLLVGSMFLGAAVFAPEILVVGGIAAAVTVLQ
jgi:hypothetical protein